MKGEVGIVWWDYVYVIFVLLEIYVFNIFFVIVFLKNNYYGDLYSYIE